MTGWKPDLRGDVRSCACSFSVTGRALAASAGEVLAWERARAAEAVYRAAARWFGADVSWVRALRRSGRVDRSSAAGAAAVYAVRLIVAGGGDDPMPVC